MGSAFVSSAISTAAIATINNQGNLFAAAQDITTLDTAKNLAVSVIAAGVLAELNPAIVNGMNFGGLPTEGVDKYGALFVKSGLNNLGSAFVGTSIAELFDPENFAQELGDSLKLAGLNTLGEVGATAIGDGYHHTDIDNLSRYAMHAALADRRPDIAV
jgi:hypothetical protein